MNAEARPLEGTRSQKDAWTASPILAELREAIADLERVGADATSDRAKLRDLIAELDQQIGGAA